MTVALPNTVRHHGAHIPRGMIVRTMRGQRLGTLNTERWIEYVPAPRPPARVYHRGRRGYWLGDRFYPSGD